GAWEISQKRTRAAVRAFVVIEPRAAGLGLTVGRWQGWKAREGRQDGDWSNGGIVAPGRFAVHHKRRSFVWTKRLRLKMRPAKRIHCTWSGLKQLANRGEKSVARR
ncbi:hypothetical protein ACFQDN_20960, partial [Pseudomonas asuensis]